MSNRDQNDFDDFENDPFNFGDDQDDDLGADFFDQDPSANVGDDLDDDMPVIEEQEEERGGNRTFLVIAVLLILVLVIGLGAVLFLATRNTGPTELDYTTTAIVEYNATQLAFGALTATAGAEQLALTQTAAAWTATPTATFTASPTEVRPTITPTPSNTPNLDLTVQAMIALTQAALPTVPPTLEAPTEPPTAEAQSVELNIADAFSTQVAFATAQGAFDQGLYSTQVAIATQFSGTGGLDPTSEAALAAGLSATQSALDAQFEAVQQAIDVVDRALQTAAVNDPFIATQLSALVPIGQATQTALAGQSSLVTQVANQTRQAIATEIFNATAQAGGTSSIESRMRAVRTAPLNAKAMFMPGYIAQVATVEPTLAVYQTLAAQSTQAAFDTQSQLGTAAAGAAIRMPQHCWQRRPRWCGSSASPRWMPS